MIPDSLTRLPVKQQSMDDAYGIPENFLEVEVSDPQTRGVGKFMYTDYKITLNTNIPAFKIKSSTVRRRYSDFEWLKETLEREVPRVTIPSLPGKILILRNKFDEDLIEKRRQGLERFIQVVAGHPLLQTGSKVLGPFLQDPNWSRNNYNV
jgi:sorting nexin-3/12